MIREHTPLPKDLADIQVEVEQYARDYGLDFFPTIFEVVDYDQISELAAYGGFPVRYPHWRFGMQYEELAKGYAYGLQKIYEMVINTDPCYAYLMRCNPNTDQKLVMAHVYGHCDFFKNNYWFSKTNRKMMDEMANHGQRIRGYIDRFGIEEVETFIDRCLSLEELIDIHSPFIQRKAKPEHQQFQDPKKEEPHRNFKFKAKDYMDPYINPAEMIAAEQDKEEENAKDEGTFPAKPERDVLQFLLNYAPLKAWEADVLSIIREEAYYFAPQAQTKIMNEGWASYWHSTIMTKNALTDSELFNYADHHSGTVAMSATRLNPYKVGIELFRDIEERWNKGKFGKEYEECEDWQEKQQWDKQLNLGREKIFEVRRDHNDVTFIDTFLTAEFCHRYKLFSFGYNEQNDTYEIESREFPKIKQKLLSALTNRGQPLIHIIDANYKNRGELVLDHTFQGTELQIDYAQDTLENLCEIWKRPVHIKTVLNDCEALLSFDGIEHTKTLSEEVDATLTEVTI